MMGFLRHLFTFGKDQSYEMAVQYYNDHRYRQAIQKFEEILKQKTSSRSLYNNLARFYCGQAHRNLGILLFTLGNFSMAATEFEQAIQYNPDHMEIYHYLGICQNNLGEFEKAVDTFNRVLSVDPSYLEVKAKLGIVFHNLKMWDKAISVYDEIIQIQPDSPDIQYRLGLAHLGQGRAPDAVIGFKRALDLNPHYIQARIKLGITHAYLGNFDDAVSQLSVIIEKFPRYADIHYFLGIIHSCRDELSEAIESFRHALEINPNFKDTKVKLGILYCRMKKFNEALMELEEAQNLDPENENLEMMIFLIKRHSQSSDRDAPHELSDVFDWISKDESIIVQTIREMNKHIEITPDFSEIISMIKKFPHDDISLYKMLIPLMEDYIVKHSEYSDLHNDLGSLYAKLKRFDDAEEAFRKALQINPNYTEALFNLFNVLRVQKKYKEAFKEGHSLLGRTLTYPDFYCGLGEVYLSLGMIEEAHDILHKALEKNPAYGEAYFFLAELYEKQGKQDKAMRALQDCLDSNPPQRVYNLARKALNRIKSKI